MVGATGTVLKAATNYGRQQFYADRAAKIKAARGPQVGVKDSVTLSHEAVSRSASSTAPPAAKPVRSGPVTYENLRKTTRQTQPQTPGRRQSDRTDETGSMERAYRAAAG